MAYKQFIMLEYITCMLDRGMHTVSLESGPKSGKLTAAKPADRVP